MTGQFNKNIWESEKNHQITKDNTKLQVKLCNLYRSLGYSKFFSNLPRINQIHWEFQCLLLRWSNGCQISHGFIILVIHMSWGRKVRDSESPFYSPDFKISRWCDLEIPLLQNTDIDSLEVMRVLPSSKLPTTELRLNKDLVRDLFVKMYRIFIQRLFLFAIDLWGSFGRVVGGSLRTSWCQTIFVILHKRTLNVTVMKQIG